MTFRRDVQLSESNNHKVLGRADFSVLAYELFKYLTQFQFKSTGSFLLQSSVQGQQVLSS